jgi:hypothetical protein
LVRLRSGDPAAFRLRSGDPAYDPAEQQRPGKIQQATGQDMAGNRAK